MVKPRARKASEARPDMKTETPQSHGHPVTVAAVVGSFALAVGLVVRASGVMRGAEEGLLHRYRDGGFPIAEGASQPWWGLVVILLLVYGLAILLLEIPGTSRRVMLAVTLLVLVAAASPVVALWGVFWSPLVAFVSGAWSAFCATLWAKHHTMPCETAEAPGDGKVISMEEQKGKVRKKG